MSSFIKTLEDEYEREKKIAERVLKEVHARLGFLLDVGLDYLSLERAAATLSGGEAQRIRLATQIGSGLVGVLYVLDEPSIGLHQRDNRRLIETLTRLRDLAEKSRALMAALPGVTDLSIERQDLVPQVRIRIDAERAAHVAAGVGRAALGRRVLRDVVAAEEAQLDHATLARYATPAPVCSPSKRAAPSAPVRCEVRRRDSPRATLSLRSSS